MISPGRIKPANGIALIGIVPTLIATATGPDGQETIVYDLSETSATLLSSLRRFARPIAS